MKRRRRTEILIEGSPELAKKFARTIMNHYTCKEVAAPYNGLTMIKMRESAQNSLFYLGEVLITEAKVEINGKIGIGIVIGMKEELARHLAIIDAAYSANLPETFTWEAELIEAEEEIKQHKINEQEKILQTKVDFQTMDV